MSRGNALRAYIFCVRLGWMNGCADGWMGGRTDLRTIELQMVFQSCNHPFVLQMHYAFQTELHAIIVLNLVTTGNLQVKKTASPTRNT